MSDDFALLDRIVARALASAAPPGPPTFVERIRQDHAVPREQLRDHCLLALIASADNPPNATAFTLWLLSRHPGVQEQVRAEVLAAASHDVPTPDTLDRMPLLERCVQESMRLFPPVWWLARIAQTDTVLQGFVIPAGTMVFLHTNQVHRHLSAWTDPESFRPDRFLPDRIEARSRYAYLPFGAGPRRCVGSRLATLQMRSTLASILQRFRLMPAGPNELLLEGKFALRSRNGVPIQLAAL